MLDDYTPRPQSIIYAPEGELLNKFLARLERGGLQLVNEDGVLFAIHGPFTPLRLCVDGGATSTAGVWYRFINRKYVQGCHQNKRGLLRQQTTEILLFHESIETTSFTYSSSNQLANAKTYNLPSSKQQNVKNFKTEKEVACARMFSPPSDTCATPFVHILT